MGPKRLEQMKAIEAKPQIIDGAPEIDGEKVDVRLPPAVELLPNFGDGRDQAAAV
jgi:hypothetical protein